MHLLALARESGVDLAVDDFNYIGAQVPMLANLAPSGRYNWADVDRLGGLPPVMKSLYEAGMIHSDCLTVTGVSVGENLDRVKSIEQLGPERSDILFPVKAPWASPGHHISILRGSLAPDGAVIKLSGKQIKTFKGVCMPCACLCVFSWVSCFCFHIFVSAFIRMETKQKTQKGVQFVILKLELMVRAAVALLYYRTRESVRQRARYVLRNHGRSGAAW